MSATGEEESTGMRVVKLTTIIALHCLDGDTKLSSGTGKKVRLCGEGVRFES